MPLAAITIVDKVVQDKQFAVRHFVAWQEENRRIVEEVKKRGYKRVAMVTTINDATLALRDGFLKESGVEVVLNQEFARDDMDFQAVAAKIKAAKPDAVYNLLFSPQNSTFMKTLRALECTLPAFAVHNVEDPSAVVASQGSFNGIWFVTGDDRAGNKYREAYQQRFGSLPAMGWANAFDYAKMIIEAAKRGVPVLSHLKHLQSFEGAFGTYGSAEGNAFQLKATVKTIEGGRFVEQ